MAKRMSNKERIQRKGAEAAAAAVEKEKAKGAPKPPKSKSATGAGTSMRTKRSSGATGEKRASSSSASTTRLKLVWKVFNASGKEVAVFPYPERAEADAMAQKLSTKSGSPHFVNGVKVPFVSEV